MWGGLILLALAAALCLSSILQFGPSQLNVCWLGMTAGLMLALPRGRPLARQIGFFVAGIHIGLGLLMIYFGAGVGLFYVVFGTLLGWSLKGEAVRRFFGLRCPACDSPRTRARGLFYSGVRCRDCGREWEAA
jgi:hypothetical protein